MGWGPVTSWLRDLWAWLVFPRVQHHQIIWPSSAGQCSYLQNIKGGIQTDQTIERSRIQKQNQKKRMRTQAHQGRDTDIQHKDRWTCIKRQRTKALVVKNAYKHVWQPHDLKHETTKPEYYGSFDIKKFQCVTTTRWFSVLPGSHRQWPDCGCNRKPPPLFHLLTPSHGS